MPLATLDSALSYLPQYNRVLTRARRALVTARTPEAAARVTIPYQAALVVLAEQTVAMQAQVQGLDAATVATAAPAGWAGYAAGGALLTTYFGAAATPDQLAGMAFQTLKDTFISAQQVVVNATPTLTGYVRYLNPPSCARCAILAGRFYREFDGWERHENCDCQMVPTGDTPDPSWIADPMEAWRKGQIRNSRTDPTTGKLVYSNGLTKAQEQAVRDGANLGQVVNATGKRAGVQTIGFGSRSVQVSLEGTTVRGNAYSRKTGRPTSYKLTPAAIYQVAESRDDVLRLLALNGYYR